MACFATVPCALAGPDEASGGGVYQFSRLSSLTGPDEAVGAGAYRPPADFDELTQSISSGECNATNITFTIDNSPKM